jgi:hypothetical protein
MVQPAHSLHCRFGTNWRRIETCAMRRCNGSHHDNMVSSQTQPAVSRNEVARPFVQFAARYLQKPGRHEPRVAVVVMSIVTRGANLTC